MTSHSCISINSKTDINMLLPLPVNSVSAITSQNFMPSLLQRTSTLASRQILRSSGTKCPIVPFWICRHLFPCSLMTSLQMCRPPKPPRAVGQRGWALPTPPHQTTLHHHATSLCSSQVGIDNNTKCGGFLNLIVFLSTMATATRPQPWHRWACAGAVSISKCVSC